VKFSSNLQNLAYRFLQLAIIIDVIFLTTLILSDDPNYRGECFWKIAKSIYYFLHSWQTLLAAFFAIVAAKLTVSKMQEQIRSSERQHEEQIKITKQHHNDTVARKKRSLRAHLPDALSGLIAYNKACLNYIHNFGKGTPEQTPTPNPIHIDALKNYIAYADNKISKEMRNIVNEYQALNTTIESLLSDASLTKKDYAYRSLLGFNALVLEKFPHARSNPAEPKIHLAQDNEGMTNSLRQLMGITQIDQNRDLYDEVIEVINRYYPEKKP